MLALRVSSEEVFVPSTPVSLLSVHHAFCSEVQWKWMVTQSQWASCILDSPALRTSKIGTVELLKSVHIYFTPAIESSDHTNCIVLIKFVTNFCFRFWCDQVGDIHLFDWLSIISIKKKKKHGLILLTSTVWVSQPDLPFPIELLNY